MSTAPEPATDGIHTPDPQPPPLRGVEGGAAPACAPPREKPDPSVADSESATVSATPATVTLRDRARSVSASIGRLVRAIPVPTGRQAAVLPSWQQLLWHAEHGDHLPDGWPRRLTVLWVKTVGRIVAAAAKALVWVGMHPARALLTVLTVVAVLAPLGWI